MSSPYDSIPTNEELREELRSFPSDFLVDTAPIRSGVPTAAILRIVVENGIYDNAAKQALGMCHAVRKAHADGLISKDEFRRARREVGDYVYYLNSRTDYLANALYAHGLPNSFADMKRIYMDWDNRPRPRKR